MEAKPGDDLSGRGYLRRGEPAMRPLAAEAWRRTCQSLEACWSAPLPVSGGICKGALEPVFEEPGRSTYLSFGIADCITFTIYYTLCWRIRQEPTWRGHWCGVQDELAVGSPRPAHPSGDRPGGLAVLVQSPCLPVCCKSLYSFLATTANPPTYVSQCAQPPG